MKLSFAQFALLLRPKRPYFSTNSTNKNSLNPNRPLSLSSGHFSESSISAAVKLASKRQNPNLAVSSDDQTTGDDLSDLENDYTETPQYPQDVPSVYDKTDKRLAQARKFMAQIIRDLPTVPEKIDFVNPYERPWEDVEIRRHRDYMRPMKNPRKAYLMSPVPSGYDSLNMYKYVTNTHCIKGLPKHVYDSINIEQNQLSAFAAGVLELLKHELKGRQNLSESVGHFLEQLSDLLIRLFADQFEHLKDTQIGLNAKYESFSERAGFRHLYGQFKPTSRTRLITDHVHRLGQLAFVFRDVAELQFRSKFMLKPFIPIDDELCKLEIDRFLYSPGSYTFPDGDPIYMVPGFEYGDKHDFGYLMINSMKNIHERMSFWKAEREEFDEVLLSMALSSNFSWLNGQAHFKGFTQYTDITYPFCTQSIFTDGRLWYFSCYQLNTLDLLYNFDLQDQQVDESNEILKKPNKTADEIFEAFKFSGKSSATNLCWYEGPYQLFDFDPTSGKFTNLDETVLEKILKFVANKPDFTPADPTPYIKEFVKEENLEEELIERSVQESANIKYTT